MLGLIDIGFLPIRIWDILDVIIVGYLIYRVYKLLRGSVAFNIFVGVLALYGVYWLVQALGMDLLSSILNQFVNVGVLMLLIIFQPEVRRFLLFVGNTTLKGRSNFINRILGQEEDFDSTDKLIYDIRRATKALSKSKTGALILLSENTNVEEFSNSGTILDAKVSVPLLISLFHKESPLHDGAVIIAKDRIHSAGNVLPVSGNPDLPERAGLRHRAGVGVTEGSDVISIIVSEETGNISLAQEGKLTSVHDVYELASQLKKRLKGEEASRGQNQDNNKG